MKVGRKMLESFLETHPLKETNSSEWFNVQSYIMKLYERDLYKVSKTKKHFGVKSCECPMCHSKVVKYKFCPHCGQRLLEVNYIEMPQVTMSLEETAVNV